jgi:branched-subunit amino acid transport protein
MNLWLVIIGMGIITYLLRLTFIALLGRVQLPPLLGTALHYVPAAVLSAIIFPEILLASGRLDVSLSNPRLLAGIVATGVAYRTRNALITIIVGMIVLWIAQWLLSPSGPLPATFTLPLWFLTAPGPY